MKARCPVGHAFEVDESRSGHKCMCPECGRTVRIPAGDADTPRASRREPDKDAAVARPGPRVQAQPSGGPTATTIHEGDRLGPFELLGTLGQGGMGAVYLALHTKLKKEVALKVLPAERMADERAVARFQREIQVVSKLDHPNIVRFITAGEKDDTHFFVMEYVRGLNLAALVARCGPLPVADACQLIGQAAVGLQHAHSHGLVHRDIKPSNLMLSASGELKILDLGIARLSGDSLTTEELTAANQTIGTLHYMAPEQCDDSRSVDIRADIYGLGCTLYMLLTGEPPFGGPENASPQQIMLAHLQEPIPSLCARRPYVPAELMAVLERMMAKDPADRFATPADVARALAPWATGCDLAALVRRAEIEPPSEPSTEACQATTPEYLATAADTRPDHGPARTEPGGRVRQFPVAAVLLVGLALLGLTGVVGVVMSIRAATDHGELVIECSDPDVQVLVKHSGVTIKQWTLEQGTNRTTIRSGQYEIELVGANADRLIIDNDKITLARGQSVVATVARVRTASVIPPTPPVPPAPPTHATSSVGWFQSGFDAQRTGFNPHEERISPTNVAALEVLWTNSVPSTINRGVCIVDGVVYYGHYGGEFRAVDAATGKRLWTRSINRTHTGQAVADGVVYVTARSTYDYGGEVYAFDATNGAPLWKWNAGDGQVGSPIIADGVLYATSKRPNTRTLYAMDAETGNEIWSVSPGGAAAVAEGVVYVSASSNLRALRSKDGELLWEGPTEADQLSGPAVAGGVVYVHSSTGHLYAFDTGGSEGDTRSPLWSGVTQEQKSPQHPAVAEGRVYVGAKDTFYSFDAKDGEASERRPVWTATTECSSFPGHSPSVANGVVYTTCGKSYLYAFDAATGEVLWKYYTKGTGYSMRSSPVIADGRLYHAATFDFKLYAFHLPEQPEPSNLPVPIAAAQVATPPEVPWEFVTFGWKPSWSPDGNRLAFVKSPGRGIRILDLESEETTDLVPTGKDPAWSPDGRFIAYVEEPGTPYASEEVWVVALRDGKPRKVLNGGYPNWSPDGKTLFAHSRKRKKVLALDVDRLDSEPTVFSEHPRSWYPAISPDGKAIASGVRGALVVVDRESGEEMLRWPTPGNRGLLPAWSRDGRQVGFGGFDDSDLGLWVLDVETKTAVQVAGNRYTMPEWSPDGTRLAFDCRSGVPRQVFVIETKSLDALRSDERPGDRPADRDSSANTTQGDSELRHSVPSAAGNRRPQPANSGHSTGNSAKPM